MKVIVTNKYKFIHEPKGVRKCPPNYKPEENEWVLELDDYTEEDIKKYFTKEDLTAWKEEHDQKGIL